jgi:hypothetical protein
VRQRFAFDYPPHNLDAMQLVPRDLWIASAGRAVWCMNRPQVVGPGVCSRYVRSGSVVARAWDEWLARRIDVFFETHAAEPYAIQIERKPPP